MSATPLHRPSTSRRPAFLSPRPPQKAPATPTPPWTYGESQSLLPRTILNGCREAVQRLREPDRRTYAITSSVRGEGRSTVAIGIAAAEWLDRGLRTVIVDLDLEQPSLHRRLGLAEGPGIADLAGGQEAVEDHLQHVAGDIWLLSAGRVEEEPMRSLGQVGESHIISQLLEWADVVVYDLPPLIGSPAGIEAVRLCGSPVLVVRAGVTPLPVVKQASELLAVAPPVVLNGVWSALPRWIRRAAGEWTPT